MDSFYDDHVDTVNIPMLTTLAFAE